MERRNLGVFSIIIIRIRISSASMFSSFQPGQERLSVITETLSTGQLLKGKLVDPLRLNRIVLENPGSFTT